VFITRNKDLGNIKKREKRKEKRGKEKEE